MLKAKNHFTKSFRGASFICALGSLFFLAPTNADPSPRSGAEAGELSQVQRAAASRVIAPQQQQQNPDNRQEVAADTSRAMPAARGQVDTGAQPTARNISEGAATPVARTAIPLHQGSGGQAVSRAAVVPQQLQQLQQPQQITDANRAPVSRVPVQPQTVSRVAVGTAPAAPAPASARSATVSRAASATGTRTQGTSAMARAFHENEKGIANADASVRRAGISLRPTVAEVGGRAIIGETGQMTGSNVGGNRARIATTRTDRAATTAVTAESVAEMTDRMMATGDMNAACFQQYSDCMDQFCAVLDANQKRCTCSDRISTYARIETATREANRELNEVAQKIRYVGLTADEIRAIMSATEAEMAMQGMRDDTMNRRMLSQIEELIRSPQSFNSMSNESFGLDMDIDFNISGDVSEMFSLDGIFGSGGSFANLRGVQLYNAAKRRCDNVLNACRRAGANVAQITGRYEIEIDRDCVAYEQGLERMNQTLRENIRAATQMLQRARLAVLQNHNQFDMRGCIGALEQCMLDEMVCGRDYVKCIDPTKMFIDENGKVVLGRDIVTIRNSIRNFNAMEISLEGLPVTNCDVETPANQNGRCIINFLLQRIGTGSGLASGFCRPVLDRCRAVTYDRNGQFIPHNPVVKGFIERAMVNIRASQEQVISGFAQSCMQDVAFCYSQQVSQVTAWTSGASVQQVHQVMRGACRNVALTCAYAVFAAPVVAPGCVATNTQGNCRCAANATAPTNHTNPERCIEQISEMFFQNMLCPTNATLVQSSAPCTTIDNPGTHEGCVNTMCKCNSTFMNIGDNCVPHETCPTASDTGTVAAIIGGTGGTIPNYQHCRCPAGSNWRPSETGGTNHACRT